MKRVLITSILGLAVSVVSSYGQADYFFDTYGPVGATGAALGQGEFFWNSTPALAPAGLAGLGVTAADNVFAVLNWSVASGPGAGSGSLTPVQVGLSGFPDLEAATAGEAVFDPTYVSGTPIQFTLQYYQGANFASAPYNGSVSWTDPGMVTGAGAVFFDSAAFPHEQFIISATIPEPTTLALAGLGLAGLMIFRKRA
jgi:hypothetical protein